jgi:hypothetical protein
VAVLGDGRGLGIQMHLNGRLMQNDTTSNMVGFLARAFSRELAHAQLALLCSALCSHPKHAFALMHTFLITVC